MANEKDFLVQKIRTQYMEKEFTDLDALRELDKKVKLPANIFAYTFGSIGAIIAGAGMSLTMTDLYKALSMSPTAAMVVGIILGLIGMGVAAVAYPVYNLVLERMRKKVAPEILRLADELEK